MARTVNQADTLRKVLASQVPDEALREELKGMGLKGTYAEAVSKALLDRAIAKGDVETAKFLREALGEKTAAAAASAKPAKPAAARDLTRLTDEELEALI